MRMWKRLFKADITRFAQAVLASLELEDKSIQYLVSIMAVEGQTYRCRQFSRLDQDTLRSMLIDMMSDRPQIAKVALEAVQMAAQRQEEAKKVDKYIQDVVKPREGIDATPPGVLDHLKIANPQ